jgi:hypothetical protein
VRISKILSYLSLFFALAVSGSLRAQVKAPGDIQKACRGFVQGFYDWYVPKVLKEGSVRALGVALKYKGNSFDPELSRELREDSAAQAKVTGEIVGVDFDPFLNTQDPDEGYVAGSVTLKNGRCWVEVYAVRSGTRSEKPVVIPELATKNSQWLFVNFHYGNSERPETENLLSVLKNFRELRQKSHN